MGKLLVDLLLGTAVYALAFACRFEGQLTEDNKALLLTSLPLALLVQSLCLIAFQVPRQTWRFFSLPEAGRLFVSLGSAAALLAILRLGAGLFPKQAPKCANIPLGILLMDLLLLLTACGATRMGLRLSQEQRQRKRLGLGPGKRRRTILLGAGPLGAILAREIARRPSAGIVPVGFLDDDASNQGTIIHGLPVLGSLADLGKIQGRYQIEQAIIGVSDHGGKGIRPLVKNCEACGLAVKVIGEILDNDQQAVNLSSLRDVAIEDLLGREPVSLDREAIANVVRGRTILVTGAGGSIGSELCREIGRFEPARLVLVEKSENSLFHIKRLMKEGFPEVKVASFLADICDTERMDAIFSKHRPEVVFHAAAHKHVPIMEEHPEEAVFNNVVGTKQLADLAHAHGVGEFVMISTDKAVNPTSVMGVSKRTAEIYIQALSQRSATRFVTVRFGNVLGSNGSVIPIFTDQIKKGGPLTVTHPDMTRYFMTIPEACQLVLQAASMGKGGEIFILDMGEPVKIIDLARDLIRLSGLSEGDVEIRYIGIRPGEKLYEELSLDEEGIEKTAHPRVFIGKLKASSYKEINQHISELVDAASEGDAEPIREKFGEIVCEYQPSHPPAGRSTSRASEQGMATEERARCALAEVEDGL